MCPDVLHAGPFFHRTSLKNPGQAGYWIPLPPWHSPGSALEAECHDFSWSFICNKMESLPKLGVLEHKSWWKTCRDIDSWLEGNLLYVLTSLFLKQTNTDTLFLQIVSPSCRPSSAQPPLLVVFNLFGPVLLHLPSRPSSLCLPPPAPSLPPLCIIIFLNLSIWSILKAKVKPKSGLEPRHHFLKWQPLVIGRVCNYTDHCFDLVQSQPSHSTRTKGLISAASRSVLSSASVFTELHAVLASRFCCSSVEAPS